MKLLRRQLCQILLYARLLPLSCAKQQTVYHAHHAAQLPFFSTAAPQSLALTDWLSAQKNVSWQGILKNIYGVDSAYPGVVVAAPPGKTGEREDAGTYWYNWTRDAALVMKGLVRRFAKGDKSLEPLIRAYISNAEALQRVPNRSGDITTGGLGEPKFNVDGTAFQDDWGRPQHDGPALRALVIMHALKHIDDQQYVSHVLTNVVKPDMEHVAKFWNDAGFDLWEEVRGLHFFTAMVQSRALREAMDVFWVAGDQGAAEYYREQHQKLAIKIEEFWNYRNGGTFQSHLDLGSKPTGVDAGNLLAVLHGAGGIAPLYRPSSAKTLASLASLVKAMQPLYPLNAHLKQGVAIGRYPSDIYDGSGTSIGNPWFLCTSAVAEILYLAASEIETVKQFQVNNINKNFAQMLDGGLQADTVVKGRALSELLGKMRTLGDDFLAVQQQFVTANLSMSEQYSRQDGHQLGARDLTWSYAAFYSAVEAREGQLTYEYS